MQIILKKFITKFCGNKGKHNLNQLEANYKVSDDILHADLEIFVDSENAKNLPNNPNFNEVKNLDTSQKEIINEYNHDNLFGELVVNE
jgi:hypothetical protein